MTALELLRDAREYVCRGWTQHAYARAENGEPTGTCAGECWDRPVCWCASGALRAALAVARRENPAERDCFIEADRALRLAVPPEVKLRSYVTFNDMPGTTQADIVALFDRAIEAVRS